jgi:DNA-binding NarL/FixJ family response regulator
VLVVDDEPAIRGVLVEILAESGFTVVGEASDGVEALEMARVVQPDVVILDIKMPRLDGIAAAARLRAEHESIRTVIFSAYDDDVLRERAREAGADAFLVKGCPWRDVVAAIGRA